MCPESAQGIVVSIINNSYTQAEVVSRMHLSGPKLDYGFQKSISMVWRELYSSEPTFLERKAGPYSNI